MDKLSMKYDEIARNLCKPLGCRVVACMSEQRSGGCSAEMNALNACLREKRSQIDAALR
jgi:hypothetical protein